MTIDSILTASSGWHIEVGDCLQVLRSLPDACVQTVVTSPPYWGLRDYGLPPSTWADGWVGPLGLEPTPMQFIDHLVEWGTEVHRVLRPDGTAWINMGDSYSGSGVNDGTKSPGISKAAKRGNPVKRPGANRWSCPMKAKDLVGIPWMMAFALRDRVGFWLRADIIWHKPNPMPESVLDRPTKSHEYIFLLAKSERYFYDVDAIREPSGEPKRSGPNALRGQQEIRPRGNGKSIDEASYHPLGRNRRSVWEVATSPFSGAHFATYPPALVEPCILAGSREGDLVLDPFNGAGTTGLVATQIGRRYLGIELNPDYAAMAAKRIGEGQPGADREILPGKVQLGLFAG